MLDRPPLDLETLRQIGLRLDSDANWWHQGGPVTHKRLSAALHRWLDQLPDGRFIVRLDDTRYAYVEVDDAPYVVRRARASTAKEIRLTLSDGSEESLDPSSLFVGDSDALYCRVKAGRFVARLSRSAQHVIGEYVEVQGRGFALRLGDQRFPIATTHRARSK